MKLFFSMVVTVGLALSCTAFGDTYDTLATKGYRWVAVHGFYASATEEGVERITSHRTNRTDVQIVEDEDAFYLIPGKIVQIIKMDPATGKSQVRMGGFASFLWTDSRFLSGRPIRDIYGTIETPETSGLIPNQGVAIYP
jgi:hypothetical protein